MSPIFLALIFFALIFVVVMLLPGQFVATAKTRLEVLAIVFAGLFVAATWGVERYWERQPQFGTNFYDYRATGAKSPRYLLLDPATDSEVTNCKVRGAVNIFNNGSAPLYIEDTHVHTVLFNSSTDGENGKECDADDKHCVPNFNVSDVYKQLCKLNKVDGCPRSRPESDSAETVSTWLQTLENDSHATIAPVDANLLTNGFPAYRPFEFHISDWREDQHLLVIASTEYGLGCIGEESLRKNSFFTDWLNGPQSCELMRARFIHEGGCNAYPPPTQD